MKKQKIIPAIIIVLLLAINVFTLLFLNIVNVTGDSMAPAANDGDKYMNDFSWVDRDNGWTLADDEVFLMGDNRAISTDSRSFGPLKIDEVNHKIILKLKSSKKR